MGHGLGFRIGTIPVRIDPTFFLIAVLLGLGARSGELPPRRDLVVSLAGPLTGLLLIGLPALYYHRSATGLSANWDAILTDIVFVNLAWSVLNLLPVLP